MELGSCTLALGLVTVACLWGLVVLVVLYSVTVVCLLWCLVTDVSGGRYIDWATLKC